MSKNTEAIGDMLDAMRAAFKGRPRGEAEEWAMTPNPHINYVKPAEALADGQFHLIRIAANCYYRDRTRPRYVTLNADA